MKNTYWAVYNKRGKVVSVDRDKETAKEEAIISSNRHWTDKTIDKYWHYLLKDGYKIIKSEVRPVK